MKLRNLKWYHLYFLLAAFDVATVFISLFLNHHTQTIFFEAVEGNLVYLEQLKDFNELGVKAGAVNAPGNDVFDSRDVPAEKARLDAYLSQFNRALISSTQRIAELTTGGYIDSIADNRLTADLEQIQAAMNVMVEEAELIFTYFSNGDEQKAGSRMATMDRRFAELTANLVGLREDFFKVLQARLAVQQIRAQDLKWIELLIVVLALTMIGGVTVYGHRLAHAMRANELAKDAQFKEVVAAKEALELSTRRMRTLATVAPVGIFETDEMGACTFVNARWCEIAGLSPEEAAGSGWCQAVHPDDRARVASEWEQSTRNNLPFSLEYRFMTPQGKVTWVYGSSATIRDATGVVRGFVGSLTNISQRKEIENKLELARVSAEEASRAKGDFLANMSHEIRTPMNGVLGMTDLLLDTVQTPEQADLTQTIKDSANSLLTIINDILDFSKIEAGKLDICAEPTNISRLCTDIERLQASQFEEKNITFVNSVSQGLPGSVMVDPIRLRQILVNLIGNATKFTGVGGSIVLQSEIVSEPHSGKQLLQFAVTDNGIGIAPEKQAKIFEAFSQADSSTTRQFGGTGLGLTISAQLVRLLGGELQVRSRSELGSCFSFSIPLVIPVLGQELAHRASAATTSAQLSQAKTTRALKILVAEDNSVNQKLIRALLSRLGHLVTIAKNGQEAVAMSAHDSFDLILMDIQMPVLGGEAAAAAIRQREQTTGIRLPIIALTANAMEGDREKYMAAGMDDYVSKPIRRDALFGAIERVIRPL